MISIKKIAKFMVVLVIICTSMSLMVACSFGNTTLSEGNINLDNGAENYSDSIVDQVDTSKRYQTNEGFGGSAAWAYQDLGVKAPEDIQDRAMELLYGDSGLKLNIYRYNICGGGRELESIYSQGIDSTRFGESFFKSDVAQDVMNGSLGYEAFSDVDNYDFSKDLGARTLFEKAISLGNIDHVVFFATTPHYAMTTNGKTHQEAGVSNSESDNQKPETYEAFAQYLMIISDYLTETYIKPYEQATGKTITVSISPINEPQFDWTTKINSDGSYGVTQEGCHYEPQSAANMYQALYEVMDSYNNSPDNYKEYSIDLFESAFVDLNKTDNGNKTIAQYFQAFQDKEFFKHIDTVAVHSYWYDLADSYKEEFKEYVNSINPDINISMSEYSLIGCGNNNNTNGWGISQHIDMGILNARVILKDLLYMDAVNWIYWLSVSTHSHYGEWDPYGAYEDGLVYWAGYRSEQEEDRLFVSKRYYTMGNFSRYIDIGATRVDCSAISNTQLGTGYGLESVAYENLNGDIVVVVINSGDSAVQQQFTGSFSKVLQSETTNNKNWYETVYTNNSGSGVNLTIPAKSVITYVFSK